MASRVVLITGANRGIGFCILQSMALRAPSNHYVLACRDPKKAEEAITKLHGLGVTAQIDPLELDVTSDDSLKAAVEVVSTKYKKLDILINNAGIAILPKPDLSNYREAYNNTFNVNVTSVALTMSMFLPLLKETSSDPRIINVSSGRASMTRTVNRDMPPTLSIPYSGSKMALNAMTLEYSRAEGNQGVIFQVANPGHCKTEFNNFRGTKDPMDGAKVIVDLALCAREKYPSGGFYEIEGNATEPQPAVW